MSISKLASTVILATSFATIFLFAFIFYLFGGEGSNLKDALSMTASFFGGIATLVAAYIATQLFNDWRDEKNHELTSSLAMECVRDYLKAKDMFFFYIFQYEYGIESIAFKDLDNHFTSTHNKLIILNKILNKTKSGVLEKSIIDLLFTNNYQNLYGEINSESKLRTANVQRLHAINKEFLEKLKVDEKEILAERLIDLSISLKSPHSHSS